MDNREKCKAAEGVYRSLTETIKELSECPESQIPIIENKIQKWPFFRTAFFVWSQVFSRFDSIMETLSTKYDLENIQTIPFSEKDKMLLLSIMRILTKIWDNSYDRNAQNFLDRMKDFLCTIDLDVMLEALILTFRAARRFRNQRSNKNFYPHLFLQLKEIASHWQIQEDLIDIPQLCKDDTIIPPKNRSLNFWFYKAPPKQNSQAALSKSMDISPLNLHDHLSSRISVSIKLAKDDILHPVSDGPVVISVSETDILSKSIRELVSSLVAQHDIPNNFKYSLFWKLLVTKHIANPESRRKLIFIKFIAVGLIFIAYGNEFFKHELFVYEPNMIPIMADLLKTDNADYENASIDIEYLRLASLISLGCFFYHKGKLIEVLSSINVWAYHGILASLFRNVVHSLSLNENRYSRELINELFGLVFLLKNSSITGDPIVSGGYVRTLVKHIENTNPAFYGSISRAVVILDSFVNHSTQVVDAFVSTKGFDTVIKRVSEEVDWFVSKCRNITNGVETSSDMVASRITFLRSLLKFTLSLMQNSSFSENNRSLLDTSLPKSILTIFENTACFTTGMLFLALNIMSTFIHNDPTSLTVLQEMKLPQTLFTRLLEKIPVSSEIIPSLPGVFATICLNQAGLEYFTKNIELLHKFISILSSDEYIALLDNGDLAYSVGENIDEFIRHNPSLKEPVCESSVKLLEQISHKFQTPCPDDPLNYRLHLSSDYGPDSSLPPDNEKLTISMRYMNVVSRFLEGFFYESILPYEPLTDRPDVVAIILKCHLSPTIPYNFSSFSISSLLVYIMKFINISNFNHTASPIDEGILKLFDDLNTLVFQKAESYPISQTCVCFSSASEDQISNAQKILRCFIDLDVYIGLLLGMILNHNIRSGSVLYFTIQFMNEGANGSILSTLSTINSIIMCERIKLVDSISPHWFEKCTAFLSKEKNKKNPEKSPHNMYAEIFGTVPSFIYHSSNVYTVLKKIKEIPEIGEEFNTPEFKHKFKNVTMFLYLFSRIPILSISLFTAVLRFASFKKYSHSDTKSVVLNFIEEVAQYFCSQLKFSKFDPNDEKLKLQYLTSVISSIATTIFDAREESIYLTTLGPAFVNVGGIKILAEVLSYIWTIYKRVGSSLDRDENYWLFINSTFAVLLNLLVALTTSEHIKAGKMVRLYGDPHENGPSSEFDANEYLTEVMVDLSEPLISIWKSTAFTNITTPLIQFLIIQIVINIINTPSQKTSASNNNPRQVGWSLQLSSDNNYNTVRNRSLTIVPDETKIQQLTEMGFSRDASSTALSRCDNDVGSAAEYLITHHIPSEAESSSVTGQLENNAVHPCSSYEMNSSVETGTYADQVANRTRGNLTSPITLVPGNVDSTSDPSSTQIKPESNSSAGKNVKRSANKVPCAKLSRYAAAKAKIVEEFCQFNIRLVVSILKQKPTLSNQLFTYIRLSITDNNMVEAIEELERHSLASLSMIGENVDAKSEAFVFALWNVLALALKTSIGSKNKIPIAETFLLRLHDNIERIAKFSPRVLCHLLLVLDTYVAYYDKIVNLCPDDYPQAILESAKSSIVNDKRSLMNLILSVFPYCTKNADTLHAIFIPILRLAENHELAKLLPKTDFFKVIFSTKNIALFPYQADLIVMLIRRIIEDNLTMKSTIILELEKSASNFYANQDKQFLRAFIKSHLCYARNSEVLCDVLPKLYNISLGAPNPFNNKQYASIALNRPGEQNLTDNNDESKNNNEDNCSYKYMSFLERYNTLSNDPVRLENLYNESRNENVFALLDFLINELIDCDQEFTQKTNTTYQSNPLSEHQKGEITLAKSSSKPDLDVQNCYDSMLLCVKSRYILQLLAEVLTSYPNLSMYLLPKVLEKTVKNASTLTPHAHCKLTSIIGFLMNIFIGDWINISRSKNFSHSFYQNRKIISGDAATSLLIHLIKFGESWESLQNYCLQYIISGQSIDIVIKKLKNMMSLPDLSTDALFSIYAFVCQLAYDLTVGALNSRNRSLGAGSSISLSLKELIDKGFVNFITQVIKDIDIHNPRTKTILPYAIESLKNFAITAFKCGEPIEPTAFETDKEDIDNLIQTDEDSEIYDAYNNSSLQLYGYPQDSIDDEEGDEENSDVNTLSSVENEDYLSNPSDSPEDNNNNEEGQPYGMTIDYNDMDVNLIVSQPGHDELDELSDADMDDSEDDEVDDGNEEETEDDDIEDESEEEGDQEGMDDVNAPASDDNVFMSPRRNSLSELAIDDALVWDDTLDYDESDNRRQFPVFRTIGLRYNSQDDHRNYGPRTFELGGNLPNSSVAEDEDTIPTHNLNNVARVALGIETYINNGSEVTRFDIRPPIQTRIYNLEPRRDRRRVSSYLGNRLMEIIDMRNNTNVEYDFIDSGDTSNRFTSTSGVMFGPRSNAVGVRTIATSGSPDSYIHPFLRKCSNSQRFAFPTWLCANTNANNNFDEMAKELFQAPCSVHHMGNEFGYTIWLNMVCFTELEDVTAQWENSFESIESQFLYRKRLREKVHKPVIVYDPENVPVLDRILTLSNFKQHSTLDRWIQELLFRYGECLTHRGIQVEKMILDLNKNTNPTTANTPLESGSNDVGSSDSEKEDNSNEAGRKRYRFDFSQLDSLPRVAPQQVFSGEVNIYPLSMMNRLDLSRHNIDIEFLSALPQNLRQEMLTQYMVETSRTANYDEDSTENMFNDLPSIPILPLVMRNRQMRHSTAFNVQNNANDTPLLLQAPSESSGSNTRGNNMNNESTAMEVDENNTNEADSKEKSAHTRKTSVQLITPPLPEINDAKETLKFDLRQFPCEVENYANSKKTISELRNNANTSREAINILDRASVAALLRLLFLPEPIAKGYLYETLIYACENSVTVRDVLYILLTILFEEINDFQSAEKLFSGIMSKHNSKNSSSQQKRQAGKIQSVPPHYAENIPNLILRRCLDVLVSILTNNKVLKFLFTEDQKFVNKILQNSKKCNKKALKPDCELLKRPVILLFNILERPLFLSNAALTELIMFILVSILHPVSMIKNLNKNGKNSESQGTNGDGNIAMEGYLQDISDLCLGSQVIVDGNDTEPYSERNIVFPKIDAMDISGKEYHKKFDLPAHYIKLISNVLVNDVCSKKTFQCTISLIHTICLICNNKKQVICSILSVVQSLVSSLIPQLELLNEKLNEYNDLSNIRDGTFNMFSSPSSDQAKLLRVLKTADYIHYKATNTSESGQEANSDGSSFEQDLVVAYNELKLDQLWNIFSNLLSTIGSFENLTNTATVLLPLIESFMIVMKPYVLCKQPTGPGNEMIGKNRELFFKFTEDHKRILNAMIFNNSSLMNGSFSLLIQNTKILDFENKCYYFHRQLHMSTDVESTSLQINVRRKYIFEDSYHQMRGYSGEEIKYANICVSFYNEEGLDAGGLSREWFSALARQMFNPDYALFRPSANDKVTYQPNRLSYVNSDHLMYFKFVRTIIGKAIFDKHLLDAYFTRSFYKAMIDSPVDIKDMEAVDPEFYKSLEWILNNDITDVLDLTFCTEIDEFGNKKIIELVPKGSQIPVTEENKNQYVKLIVEQHLYLNIKVQIDSFMSGLYEIVPKELLEIFNEQELELLISGLPDIDIDDWKNNTDYHNYTSSSPQIIWFWRTVRSFTQEERAKLLQFCTGTSKVPLEGFQGFQIHRDFSSTNRLPSAHTCFNQLDLPAYESYEVLRKYVILAISEGNVGFGFV